MDELLFFEKPGCVGNRRQQALLRAQGYRLQVRDLLAESWDSERLRPFFGDLAVADWFNASAPQVKSRQIDIHALGEREALDLMARQPLLIRRPLLQWRELRQSGFLPGPVLRALGFRFEAELDLQSCPVAGREPACEEPS